MTDAPPASSDPVPAQLPLPGATAGLVLGICSIVVTGPIVGLVLGIIGYTKSRVAKELAASAPDRYRYTPGVVTAGCVCSIIGIVLGVLSLFVAGVAVGGWWFASALGESVADAKI